MKFFLRAVVVTLLFFSSVLHANPTPDVGEWVKQTLSDTFLISFEEKQDNLVPIRNNYTYDSWSALVGFLGDYMETTRNQKLVVHPLFKEDPIVVGQGISSGIQFWRVNQTVVLPEFKVELFFSILVLLRSANSEDPYVIQSMDIIKRDY
ncbi:hypothetical protein [Legionella maioricensis]|uniref:Protein IcmL (DotI) n=1 Tax=Legionella maioricensis TaxID=2896528 RepID=A0A9X2CZC1_9GAMM|nr:hypothetical protein [Legionella maioricensis]MCL9683250.1 hypothetical protein [Legionella maioricensis]MCL9686052.1 hypothetical protein [Legionella maioricensis]